MAEVAGRPMFSALELLLGFDEAERIARDAGGTVLGDLPRTEAGQKQLYGGLITVLLRLVFLLYAEDEALMPAQAAGAEFRSLWGGGESGAAQQGWEADGLEGQTS